MQLSFWKEPPLTVSQFILTRLTSHSYSLTATLIFLSSWIFLQPEKFFPPVSPLRNRLGIAPLINTAMVETGVEISYSFLKKMIEDIVKNRNMTITAMLRSIRQISVVTGSTSSLTNQTDLLELCFDRYH